MLLMLLPATAAAAAGGGCGVTCMIVWEGEGLWASWRGATRERRWNKPESSYVVEAALGVTTSNFLGPSKFSPTERRESHSRRRRVIDMCTQRSHTHAHTHTQPRPRKAPRAQAPRPLTGQYRKAVHKCAVYTPQAGKLPCVCHAAAPSLVAPALHHLRAASPPHLSSLDEQRF